MDQQILTSLVKAVVDRQSSGLIVQGMGMAYAVCSTLNGLHVDPVVADGHLTPLELFRLLLDNHGRIIVIDDADPLLQHPLSLSVLGSVMAQERQPLRWGDDQLDFQGSVILICTNDPPELLKSKVPSIKIGA
jgi:hypothetical protein